MRVINKIILHCSDSNSRAHDDISVIKKWHLARGFNDVGYHHYIQFNGTVQRGRRMEEIGAHVKGENHDSIGICLFGTNRFTNDQFRSLRNLCKSLMNDHKLTTKDIYPHNHFTDQKTCPNFDVEFFIKKYLSDGSGNNRIYNKPKQTTGKKPVKTDGRQPGDIKPKGRPGVKVEPKAKRKPGKTSAKVGKTGSANKGLHKTKKSN